MHSAITRIASAGSMKQSITLPKIGGGSDGKAGVGPPTAAASCP